MNLNTLSLKLGRGETIVEIKKFTFFDKKGIFQISSQAKVLTVLLGDKNENFATMRFLNFLP